MQAFCPNLGDRKIKAEFEELKAAVGGEDLAYLLWHRTEGEGLGNHPGQADSENFTRILNSVNGDRIEAIKQIARQILNPTSQQTTTNRDSIDINEDIETRRNQYINNSINNWNNPNKLTGQALQDAKTRIRDNAREQFDYQELERIQNDSTMSDQEKQIAKGLVETDLMIVTGIQRINDIQDDSKTSKEDKEMFQQIKSGTKTRLKSFYSRSTKNARLINDLKQRLELLDGVDEDNIEDVFNQIEKFLLLAEQEILRTKRFVDSELKGKDLSTWDPQQINYIKYDLIGYYEGLLNSLYNFFQGDSPISKYNKQRIDSDDNATDLKELSTKLYEMMATLQADYQQSIVRPYADKILVDFVNDSDAVKDKPAFIRNMRKWLDQDTAYGDLAAGELVLGMASRSKSPIVRIIEKMISDVEFEQNRQILAKGHELIRIYNAIRPQGSQMSFRNFQTFLMERDGEDGTEGKFTGYWVRDRNYGRFYAEKDAFEQKLREEFAEKGVTYRYNEFTDRVETVFPDEDYTADNSVYNQYYDKLDEWLDKHCERRYKLEYYKAKRRYLSPAALQAQQAIQRQIDILCQNAMTEDGWIDTSKLTATERQRRKDLLREKRELACPYIFRSLSDSTITLEEKVGEAARIAEEIRKWNDFIQSHVSYKENKAKFDKALSKFPQGSPERAQFLKDNVITRINPDFWKEIFRGHEVEQTQEYKDLQSRYRFIVEHIKHQPGYSAQDLDLLGSGINTDSSAWKELHRIEQRMEEIRRTDGEYNENLEYIGSELIMSTKHNKRFYDWLKEQWMYEIAEDSNKEWDFNNMFMIENKRGQLKLLKIFGMFKPQVNQIHGIPAFIDTYSSQFSEIDESSDFVNPNWKKELKSSLQPKVRKDGTARKAGEIDYTNENYLKIQNDRGLKKLYDKLTSLMEEANSMIPSGATEHKYLLPQITGRGMAILGRSRSISDIFSSLNYGLQDFAGVKFKDGKLKLDSDLAERDLDVSTNWDLPRRPDGTIISNIPIRFVKRLKDPSIISSDVIGSVLMYYDMALNYKLKSENLPSLELLAEAINPERSTDGKKKLRKQYDKVKNMLDYRYYGKESTMGDDDGKAYSDLKKSGMQLTKKFRKLATLSMLAVNFTTIEVGYLDAFLGALADACGGKYFTKQDLMTGYWQALKSWPVILKNMGNPVVDNWMVAAMQYNQLSKSNSEIFGRTDQSKFSRILSQTRMGGYTIADYMINTMILGATYNHYRLLDMPDGSTKRFMSKSDAIDIFTKHGYTEDEAISKWEGAKTTLRQAYFTKGGDFIIKREFRPYITKKLENQIAGRLRDRTAVYNGVVPMSEKALMQQNVFGSFLTLMRNFYVNTYWERAQVGYDYLTDEQQQEKYGMYTEDNAGFVNFETGETGNALWVSGIQGMIKLVSNAKRLITGKDVRQLTQDQKYAVKRLFSEILIIAASAFIMLYSIAFARTNDYDKDKEPLWTVNIFDPENEDRGLLQFNGNNANDKMLNWLRWKLALLATRTFTERSTFWWPGTVTELINTPSTAVSFLDSTAYVLQLFMDLFEINGHDRQEVIKSGGYKGMTRGTRDIIKIASPLGVDNIVRNWHTSGIKSTLNWYSGVSPNNLLIPNKSTWEKEQGIKSSSRSKKKNKPVY